MTEQTDVVRQGTAQLVERNAARSAVLDIDKGETSLFPNNEAADLHRRWQEVQAAFVDDPRTAVRNADELVASVMTRLAEVFAAERSRLENDWDKGESVSTEDLRVVLQRYRAFFD